MPAPEPPVKVPSELQKKQEALQGEAEKGVGGKVHLCCVIFEIFFDAKSVSTNGVEAGLGCLTWCFPKMAGAGLLASACL